MVKREGYGPIGNGGNGLILHTALALDTQQGQPLGLLWQKLWNREAASQPPIDETLEQKKQRQAAARKAARARPFQEKESYRWAEAIDTVELQGGPSSRVIHIFDREGDIVEVFERAGQCQHSGVVVRAAHNRSLDPSRERLWTLLESQPIAFYQTIDIPQTGKRTARTAQVAVRFCSVALRTPYRFLNRHPLKVSAVYAIEVDCPDSETPLSWMLLTTLVCDNGCDGFDHSALVHLSLESRGIP